jgi:hypothetical protein
MNALTDEGQTAATEVDGDPFIGGELTYTRYLFEWGHANWGLELGGSFMPLSISDDSVLGSAVSRVSDAFSLGTVVPPPAPYQGTFEGPGPVLGDAPTRTLLEGQAAFSGSREIETTAFGIRLGPSVDIPMGKPVWMQISGGLHVLYADSDYTYNELVTVNGVSMGGRSGSVSEDDWLFGAYVRGQLLVSLSESLGLYASVEYLMTDEIEVGTETNRATLDFDGSFGCALGLAWSF